jgi:hypothetical protein
MSRRRGDAASERKKVAKKSKIETGVLSAKISFDKECLLLDETIEMCNNIVITLKRDDPGLVVQVEDLDRLHNALSLV